jgi:DNA-binding CsgD family transcriptional regulator
MDNADIHNERLKTEKRERRNKARKLSDEGLALQEIAQKLNLTTQAIRTYLHTTVVEYHCPQCSGIVTFSDDDSMGCCNACDYPYERAMLQYSLNARNRGRHSYGMRPCEQAPPDEYAQKRAIAMRSHKRRARAVKPKKPKKDLKMQEILRLRSEGICYREIGERLGLSAQTVWQRVSRKR